MTDEDLKSLEPVLIANLSRAIDFVKFGEAKNAALLTFASAWILASVNLAMNPVARAVPQILWGLIYGAPFLFAAAFLAMFSFLPRVDLSKLKGRSSDDPPNLLFFGDLGALPAQEGFSRLAERYRAVGGARIGEAYFSDLGCQIVVNSRIASGKYKMFRWGVDALLIGLGVYALNAAFLVASLFSR